MFTEVPTNLDISRPTFLTRRSALTSVAALGVGVFLPTAWADQANGQTASIWTRSPELRPSPGFVVHGCNPPEYPSQGTQHAKLHINQLKGAWGWSHVGEAGKDENGYPVAIRGKAPLARVLSAAQQMKGTSPYCGKFRLYGRGTGRFKIGHRRQFNTSTLPREELRGKIYWYTDFAYDGGSNLVISLIELPVSGDHVRDMAIVHHDHLEAWAAGETFMPEVVADLRLFGHRQAEMRVATGRSDFPRRGALRFMQHMQVNDIWARKNGFATMTEAQRERRYVGRDYFSLTRIQNNGGTSEEKLLPVALPVEDAVELCNLTGCDLWYNLSADILDSRVETIGNYVRDHLDPALTVYWEYGNELWNSARGFEGYQYAMVMGEAAFPELKGADAVYEWDVYRSMQIFARLKDAFAQTNREGRYMASFAAWMRSNNADGSPAKASYAAKYFKAKYARKKSDFPIAPEDIITDMSVGGYFANPSAQIVDWLARAYPDDRARARAYTRFVQHGMDGDFVDLTPDNLQTPVQGVDPESEFAVFYLIREDIEAGLDNWTGADQVLRISGRELQYRGVLATEWSTVLTFSAPPNRDVTEMLYDVQLTGCGVLRRNVSGSGNQLRHVIALRIEGHRKFAAQHGLTYHFYEAGPGSDGAPGSAPQISVGFLDVFHNEGWAAEVMSNFVRLINGRLGQIVWYKSHNRYESGYWGLKHYYGEKSGTAPKWEAVRLDIERG